MKKLSLLLVVFLFFAGCSKDNMTSSGPQADQSAEYVPHLFGTMLPEDQTPQTRGVANGFKVWSKPVAEQGLTVKFLNGTAEDIAFVKKVTHEWVKAANVKFTFVESSQDAIVRIGFDKVRFANASWAYTGTDHLKVTDQAKPTVNYANWLNLNDARKRNDVLRTFGQILGLELEYRHPNFNPGWILNDNNEIDEEYIKMYWQNQLSNYISWEDLKKIVLEPLASQTSYISSTKAYDPNSIMTWRLPEYIATNTALPKEDDAIITELSVQDKAFIVDLYGKSEYTTPKVFIELIEFEYTGTVPQFIVETTKNLGVRWDADVTEVYEPYNIPENTVLPYETVIYKKFDTSKPRKIQIGEVVEVEEGDEIPTKSYALTKFDFLRASSAKNIKILNLNQLLTYVRIIGVADPATQTFDFTDNKSIKELYLVNIENSKVVLKNCSNLETFATSIEILPVLVVPDPYSIQENGNLRAMGEVIPADSIFTQPLSRWPKYPETKYSLADGGLSITDCGKLKWISLEHTRLTSFNFSNIPSLEYVYLSSENQYIIGGQGVKPAFGGLLSSIKTLLDRSREDRSGSFIMQGITPQYVLHDTNGFPYAPAPPYAFTPVSINYSTYLNIKNTLRNRNWGMLWYSDTDILF